MKKIDETDNYKYLGVYLSRNLKPTHHILKYLKENLENKLNAMVSDIIGEHQGIYNFGRKRDSYVLFFKHI
jgi:hypothetical protein